MPRIFFCCVVAFSLAADDTTEMPAESELVTNPTFECPEGRDFPPGWSPWKPEWGNAACRIQCTPDGISLDAPNDPFAVGGVTQHIDAVQGARAYAIRTHCEFRNVPDPYKSALVRITWMQGDRPLHPAGMLVRGPVVERSGLAAFEDVIVAPENADAARLSLEVKWPRRGSVNWINASIRQTSMPAPRKVRLGTVFLRPRNSTPEDNLRLWCRQIDAAGKLKLDIVCLGEAVTRVGTQATIKDAAKPIPGPVTDILAAAAKNNNIWVVAGLTELDGDIIYNTAVLLDRNGALAGKYRKVHLPREEWRQGIRPGDSYPVFQTDFAKIGVQICYDWFFPEPEAIFALKGAEIVFAPTWGNTLPDSDGRVDGENVFRVRARDNGLYMVPSVYDGNSLIIDPMGRILASGSGKTGLVWAEIDLNKREPLDWVGHWRSIGPRHRMTDTYAPLIDGPNRPRQ